MKTFFKYILSIILVIAIVVSFFLDLFSSTMLNKNYLINKLEEIDYYTKIYEQVKTNFENYIYQSGFEEDILDNIVNKEKVKKDTIIIIDNIYDSVNDKIDIQEIKENLADNISKSLGNMNLSENQREAIDTFIEHICNEYTNTIFAFGNGSQINNIIGEIHTKIKIIKKIILMVIGIDFLVLLVLNLKRIYKFITFIGISLNISGLTLFIINVYIRTQINFDNIVILNDGITCLLKNIVNELISIINKTGITIAAMGIIFIFVSNLLHNIRVYKKTQEKNI